MKRKKSGLSLKIKSAGRSASHRQTKSKQTSTPQSTSRQLALWRSVRGAERERKAKYMERITLPFAADYGEHKVKQGDIFAVVAHTDRFDIASPFCVKYRTAKKIDGVVYLYASDEQGNIIGRRGHAIIGKYTGFRKRT